jgi:hypothetical protein
LKKYRQSPKWGFFIPPLKGEARSGDAEVLRVKYFVRFFRNLKARGELVG